MCIAAGEMLFEYLGVPPVPRPILDRGIVIGGIFLPWLVRQALTYELVASFNKIHLASIGRIVMIGSRD